VPFAILQAEKGTNPFEQWSIMSILTNTTDTTPISHQRSIRRFARRLVRLGNSFVAAVIAQRERQANLTFLCNLSDHELRDIGLARSQITGGLAEAAKDRAWLQRLRAQRGSAER
jgi:uncharacterized protein YjiS (DUF1127 family)